MRTEFADGLMFLDVTRCVLRAGDVEARIDAFIIPASPMKRATAVSEANGISGSAVFETDANRFVIQNFASFIFRARGFPVPRARVEAFILDAGRIRGAIGVPIAFDFIGFAYEFSSVVNDETFANARRLVISHFAFLVRFAGDGAREARIGAPSGRIASFVVGTVSIVVATGSRRRRSGFRAFASRIRAAFQFGFSHVTMRTSAFRPVADDTTQRVFSANSSKTARINAAVIYTSFFVTAV